MTVFSCWSARAPTGLLGNGDRSHGRPGRAPTRSDEAGAPKYCDRVMHRHNSSAAELLTSTGLTALGPVAWGSAVTPDGSWGPPHGSIPMAAILARYPRVAVRYSYARHKLRREKNGRFPGKPAGRVVITP